MEKILRSIKTNVTVSALISILLGVVLVAWPGLSVHVACIVIGAVLVVSGVSRILVFFANRDGSVYSQVNLIAGIIITLIGVWIIIKPDKIIALVPVLVGILIVVHGINNLQQAVSLCRSKYERWWIALLLGILTIALGVLLILNPFKAINITVMCIGFFLIYDGVSDIWIVSRVSSVTKKLEQELDE